MPETKGILKMYICKRRIKIMAKWQRSFFQPVLPLEKMDGELQEVKNTLHFSEWQQEREWSF